MASSQEDTGKLTQERKTYVTTQVRNSDGEVLSSSVGENPEDGDPEDPINVHSERRQRHKVITSFRRERHEVVSQKNQVVTTVQHYETTVLGDKGRETFDAAMVLKGHYAGQEGGAELETQGKRQHEDWAVSKSRTEPVESTQSTTTMHQQKHKSVVTEDEHGRTHHQKHQESAFQKENENVMVDESHQREATHYEAKQPLEISKPNEAGNVQDDELGSKIALSTNQQTMVTSSVIMKSEKATKLEETANAQKLGGPHYIGAGIAQEPTKFETESHTVETDEEAKYGFKSEENWQVSKQQETMLEKQGTTATGLELQENEEDATKELVADSKVVKTEINSKLQVTGMKEGDATTGMKEFGTTTQAKVEETTTTGTKLVKRATKLPVDAPEKDLQESEPGRDLKASQMLGSPNKQQTNGQDQAATDLTQHETESESQASHGESEQTLIKRKKRQVSFKDSVEEEAEAETWKDAEDEHEQGTKVLGVEWVPLNIPPVRRMQMLCLVVGFFIIVVLPVLGLLLALLLLFSKYWYIAVAYFLWMFYDWNTPVKGGRQKQWMRNWIVWKYMRDYFPINLHKTANLDPEKNYILGFHPHGMFSTGVFANFCTEATGFSEMFPGIKPYAMTLAMQFWFPLRREILLLSGCVDVSQKSIEYVVNEHTKGHLCVIAPGGTAEMFDAHPGHYRINLSRRKGFVRMALQQGADLVPTFSFGENDIYDQMDYAEGTRGRKIQNFIKQLVGFPPAVFHGRGIFNYNAGFLPYRRSINSVVGRPIRVDRIQKPTWDQINALHSRYIEGLKQVFEENKMKFGLKYEDKLTIY